MFTVQIIDNLQESAVYRTYFLPKMVEYCRENKIFAGKIKVYTQNYDDKTIDLLQLIKKEIYIDTGLWKPPKF